MSGMNSKSAVLKVLLIIFVNVLTPQPTEHFFLHCSNTYGGHWICLINTVYISDSLCPSSSPIKVITTLSITSESINSSDWSLFLNALVKRCGKPECQISVILQHCRKLIHMSVWECMHCALYCCGSSSASLFISESCQGRLTYFQGCSS